MKTLLQLNTSLFADSGQSTQLADRFVASWRAANPGAKVVVRDIGREPVPHLTAERSGAFVANPESRTDEQRALVAFLRFIGIDDVEFVYAEGLNMGVERKETALSFAHEAIDRIAAMPEPMSIAA